MLAFQLVMYMYLPGMEEVWEGGGYYRLGLFPRQAKKFVEAAPQVVQADVSKEEAERLKATLEAVGGTVEID